MESEYVSDHAVPKALGTSNVNASFAKKENAGAHKESDLQPKPLKGLSNGRSQLASTLSRSSSKSSKEDDEQIGREMEQQLQRECQQALIAPALDSVGDKKPATAKKRPTTAAVIASKPNETRFPSLSTLLGKASQIPKSVESTISDLRKAPNASKPPPNPINQAKAQTVDDEASSSSESEEESSSSDDHTSSNGGGSSQSDPAKSLTPQAGPPRGILKLLKSMFSQSFT